MAKNLQKEIEETQKKLELQRKLLHSQRLQAETDGQLKALQRQVDNLIRQQNNKRRS